MATNITGREFICAIKKATTWRTAVECGAGSGVLVTTEGLGDKAPKFVDDDSAGQIDIKYSYKVSESLPGRTIDGYFRYDMWDLAIALAMGTVQTPVAAEATSTAYKSMYTLKDNIDDLFATLAMKKAATTEGVWEVPSAKIHGFTINAMIGELAKIQVNLTGNKIETDATSRVNNSTTLANVTYLTEGDIVRMNSNFSIWMNAQSGDALDSGDAIYPNSFTLTYNRPMDENWSAGNEDLDEPTQGGFADTTLTLNFDKYNLDTFMQAIEDETAQKILITFQGDIIAGSTRYKFSFYLPKVEFQSASSPMSGPGKIPHNITGKCRAVTTAPTGMDDASIDASVGQDCLSAVNLFVVNTISSSVI